MENFNFKTFKTVFNGKSIKSTLLAFVGVVCLGVSNAGAVNVARVTTNGGSTWTEYDNINSAWSAARGSATTTLQLLTDVDLSTYKTSDGSGKYVLDVIYPANAVRNLTIDLNGHRLGYYNASETGTIYIIEDRSDVCPVTITDSGSGGYIYIGWNPANNAVMANATRMAAVHIVNRAGEVVLDKGKLDCRTAKAANWAVYGARLDAANAKFTMDGGTIYVRAPQHAQGLFTNMSGAEFHINGGTIDLLDNTTDSYCVQVQGEASVNMTGGTLKVTTSGAIARGIVATGATATISGGTIQAVGQTQVQAAIALTDTASLEITGGTFSANSNAADQYNIDVVRTYTPTTTISGGTFTATTGAACYGVRTLNSGKCVISDSATFNVPRLLGIDGDSIVIRGGYFKCSTVFAGGAYGAKTKVYGGYFTNDQKSAVEAKLNSGTEMIALDEGDAKYTAGYRYIVTPTAYAKVINGTERTYYTRLETAANYAKDKNNSQVVVLRDHTTSNFRWEVESGKTNTLDLNGYTVTGDGYGIDRVINMDGAGKLIIKDSSGGGTGTITIARALSSAHLNGLMVTNGGEIELQSGTIHCEQTTKSGNTQDARAVSVTSAGSKFTMKGGKLEAVTANAADGGKAYAIYRVNAGSTVEVQDGRLQATASGMADAGEQAVAVNSDTGNGTVQLKGGCYETNGVVVKKNNSGTFQVTGGYYSNTKTNLSTYCVAPATPILMTSAELEEHDMPDGSYKVETPSFTVTAATSTGTNTYGTVSAAAASVKVGSTTTITASPATGYKVTRWAVSGTGSTISPSGASNSTTTTLTMGTANTTVTVTFGGKQCTIDFDENGGTTTTNVTATYGSAMPTITPPTKSGFVFDGYYDSETSNNGTGTKYYNASGTSARNWNKNTESTTKLYAKWNNPVASVTVSSTTTYYASVAAAIDYAKTQNNSTVTVLQDESTASQLNYNPTSAITCTLNLNNHTVTYTGSEDRFLKVSGVANSKLILTDNSGSKGGKLSFTKTTSGSGFVSVVSGSATLEQQGGTIYGRHTVSGQTLQGINVNTETCAYIKKGGKIDIQAVGQAEGVHYYSNCTVQGTDSIKVVSTGAMAVGLLGQVYETRIGKLTVKAEGGTPVIYAHGHTYATGVNHSSAACTATISGGKFDITADGNEGIGVKREGGGTSDSFTISGGTFTVRAPFNARGVVSQSGSTVNVTNATFDVATTTGATAQGIYVNGGTATVGGTTSITATAATELAEAFASLNSGSITVNGGTFTSIAPEKSFGIFANDGSTVSVTGGTFTAKTPTVSGTYSNIEGIRVTTSNTVGGNVNVSGGTFTVTNSGTYPERAFAIRVLFGSATVSGSASFTASRGIMVADSYTANGDATATINGGTFTTTGNMFLAYQQANSSDASQKTSGTITVNGGKFKSTGAVPASAATTSWIQLNGGYYNEYSGTSSKTNINTYKGSGAQVLDLDSGDDMYTAGYRYVITTGVAKVTSGSTTTYYSTLASAITYAASQTNPTITVLKDISGISTAMQYNTALTSSTCTLDFNGHTVSGTVTNLLYIYPKTAGGGENNKGTFVITDNVGGGKLTTTTSLNGNVYALNVYNGTVNLSNVTIEAKNTMTYNSSSAKSVRCSAVSVRSSRRFNMTSGTLKAEGTYGVYAITSGGTTTVSGGKITATETGSGACYGVLAWNGTMTISGSPEIEATGTTTVSAATVGGNTPSSTNGTVYNGTLNISGGSFTSHATSSTAYGVYAYRTTRAIDYSTSATYAGNYGSYGTANISGGTFDVTSDGATAYGVCVQAATTYQAAKDADGKTTTYAAATPAPQATVTGGKFNVSATSSKGAVNTSADKDKLTLEGGLYNINGGLSNYTHSTKDCAYREFPVSPASEGKYNYKVARFYTITYNKGASGTGTIAAGYKAAGDNFTLSSSTFTRSGYDQTGWSTSDGGAKTYNLGGTYSTDANLTVYPFWSAKTTTVTLNANTANHGSGSNRTVTATYGSALPSFTATTAATGYHLVGYYTAATGGTKVINADGTFAANSGIWNRTDGATLTLYAHYEANTYTVVYNANDASYIGTATGSTASSSHTYDVAKALTSNGFNLAGYTFGGWGTTTGTSAATYTNGQSVTNLTSTDGGTVNLYARWNIQSYTLTWNLDGGKVTVAGTQAPVNATGSPSGPVQYGATVTAPTVTKTGYTFAGWSSDVVSPMPASAKTYTATWTPNTTTPYTVNHYQQNLDGSYPVSPTETDNLTGTTGASVTPAVKSYTGFTAPSTQTVTILADGSRVVTYNYTRNSYTLTWNANGGTISGSYTSGTVKYGATITKPADANVTRANYVFNGWNTTPAATMPAANTTYTAQWTAAVASVTIDGNTDYYTALSDAFAAANASDTYEPTIKILQTVEGITSSLSYTNTTKNGTLDLNNCTLKTTTLKQLLIINSTGSKTLTITDSSGAKNGKIHVESNVDYVSAVIVQKGKVIVNNGTIYGKNTNTDTSNGTRALYLYEGQQAEINGGTLEAEGRQKAYAIYDNDDNNKDKTRTGSTITINNGTFNATTTVGENAYGILSKDSPVTINNGTFNVTAQTNYAYGISYSGATLTINGGTINATAKTSNAYGITTGYVDGTYRTYLTIPSSSTVTVNATASTSNARAINAGYARHTIQAGTYNATTNNNKNAYGIYAQTEYVTVSGGTFTVEAGKLLSAGHANKKQAYGIYMTRSVSSTNPVKVNGSASFTVKADSYAYGLYANSLAGTSLDATRNSYAKIENGSFTVTAATNARGVYTMGNVGNIQDTKDTVTVATVVISGGVFTVTSTNAIGIQTMKALKQGSCTKSPMTTVSGGKFKISGTGALAVYKEAGLTNSTQKIQGGYYSINGNLEDYCVSPKHAIQMTAAECTAQSMPENSYKVVNAYTLTWAANGGTLSGSYTPNGLVAAGATLTAPTATKTGHTFAGWHNGSSVVTPTTMPSANTTYTAQWTPINYTVTVSRNNTGYGTVSASSVSAPYGSAITVDDNTFTVNGTTVTATPAATTAQYTYAFSSWTNASGTITGDRTITANFTRTTRSYNIVWKSEDGTSTLETDASQTYGTATAYNGSTPTKASTAQYEYTFDGWTTAANGGGTYYANGSTPAVGGAATYYAHFTATTRKYTVTVSVSPAGYGSVNKTSVANVPYGSAFSSSTNTFTINGTTVTATPTTATAQYTYAFSSWTNASGTVSGNVTVTANFTRTPLTYTVTLNTNGGTINAGNVTSYTYGVGATLPTDVTKTGYDFGGWYDNSEFSGSAVTTISTTDTGNKEYWAKWTAVTLIFTTEGNWNVAANWTPAYVPTAAHNVIIRKPCTVNVQDAKALSIVIDQSASNTGQLNIGATKALEVAGTITRTTTGADRLATRPQDLILESAAAGNATLLFDNSNDNQALVQMYSMATYPENGTAQWQYVGTPFVNTKANPNYAGSWLYKWRDATSGATFGWDVVSNEDYMLQWWGYCLTQREARTLDMEGQLLPTDELPDQIMSFQSSVVAGTPKVCANSWTAPIQIAQMDDDDFVNVDQTIYLFNTGKAKSGAAGEAGSTPGHYIAVPIHDAGIGGLPAQISSMQGFYVKKTGTAPEAHVALNYSRHVRPADGRSIAQGAMKTPKFGLNKPQWMKIIAQGSRYGATLYLVSREDFTYGYDGGWDGENINSAGAGPLMYSPREDGTRDAVSAIPVFEGALVGFEAGEDKQYTFSFTYDGDEEWYLNDLKLGISTLINAENSYTFAPTGDDTKRFVISAKPTTEVSGTDDKARKVIVDDKLYIIRSGRIYDGTGKIVKDK